MTPTEIAHSLLERLTDLEVRVVVGADGGSLRLRGPEDVLTPELLAELREQKAALLTLAPSICRGWRTGEVPPSTTLWQKLEAPKFHDTPSAPKTYTGARCTVRACQKRNPEAKSSLRFWPSRLCVACWERRAKRVTEAIEPSTSGEG